MARRTASPGDDRVDGAIDAYGGVDADVEALDRYDSDDELITGEAVALDLRPAGFALRAGGAVIDWILYFGAYLLTSVVLLPLAFAGGSAEALYGILSIFALVVTLIVAPVVVETATHGKSLGRLAVGTRIVRDDGGAAGFRHALIRALVGLFEIFMTFGGGAALFGLLNRRSKRLGDLVAGTYAQYERVGRVQPPTFGIPLPLQKWAETADVARLPAPLARRIAQFLAQAPKMTPDRRFHLARSLAVEASPFVSPIPPSDAELFLAAVTVIRREREERALELEARGLGRLGPALNGLPHGFPERG